MASIDIRRHTGVVTSTGSRIFLVFRKIPDDEENCLVLMADALPDHISQSIDALVMSREAQADVDLYPTLSRHKFNDDTYVLQSLHEKQLLQKMPVTSIDMTPLHGRTVPLSTINEQIDADATADAEAPTGKIEEIPVKSSVSDEPAVTTPAAPVDSTLSAADRAKAMMDQARDMKKVAEELRQEAITLDPSLNKKGRPADDADEAAKKAKRNEKRRKAYAKKKEAEG